MIHRSQRSINVFLKFEEPGKKGLHGACPDMAVILQFWPHLTDFCIWTQILSETLKVANRFPSVFRDGPYVYHWHFIPEVNLSPNRYSKWGSTFIVLNYLLPCHIEKLVPVRSCKLRNVTPGQYLEGWPLENTRSCKMEFVSGVKDNGSKSLVGVPSSNSPWVRYIHLSAGGKAWNPPVG